VRAVPAAQYQSRLNAGPGGFATARLFYFRAKKERPSFPMVVLINEGSASGAEIVAGRIEGFASSGACRRNNFRKRFRAECHAVAGRLRSAFYDSEILHTEQTVIQGNGVTPNIRVAVTADQERSLLLCAIREM
jgi:hypothetical protein